MNIMKIGVVALLASMAFCGCQTEKDAMAEHHFTNKLYINSDNSTDQVLFKAGMEDQKKELTISTAMPVEEDLSGVFVADASYVDRYKAEYLDSEAEALPAQACSITNPEVVIRKGSNKSSAATVTFSKLGELDRSKVYVCPIVLKNVTDINVIQSKTVVYYVFHGAALINVVCNFSDNRAGAKEWKTPEKFTKMKTFTAEALVRMNNVDGTGGVSKSFISTIMGTEGGYLLRVSDAGLPKEQLQIAGSPNQSNSDMTLTLGRWTHIACVFDNGYTTVYFDGVKVLDNAPSGNNDGVTWGAYGDDPGENNNKRYFWISYSYESSRYFDGEMSEVRIWDHCLTQEEINSDNHFYFVEPTSEGLIAYWKMNEGEGTVLHDSSPNGNDLTLRSATTWPKVTLPAAE